jgi:hydrogenase nickel incorporation protein HypA/HybF
MHELTLATSLISLASEHARQNGATKVTKINVRLGVLCGIARSLYFCFAPAARGTCCDGAELNIYEVPLKVYCAACDCIVPSRTIFSLRCARCAGPAPKVVSGREMDLISIELELPPPVLTGAGEVESFV